MDFFSSLLNDNAFPPKLHERQAHYPVNLVVPLSAQAPYVIEGHRILEALYRNGLYLVGHDVFSDGLVDELAHEYVAPLREVREARGRVHRVADRRVLHPHARAHVADNDLSRVEADAHVQGGFVLHRAEPVEHLDDVLRRHPPRYRGEAADVGEEDRDLSPVSPEPYALRVPEYLVGDVLAHVAVEDALQDLFFLELRGHLVERPHEVAHLVLAALGDAVVEVAERYLPGALEEPEDRAQEPRGQRDGYERHGRDRYAG